MKVVNSLIFNSLALRQSVNLPEIGSLRVEHSPARLKGNRLERPVTRIVYSKKETPDTSSVIELIEQQSGSDRAKAEELYHKWLEEVTQEKTITIEGVGRIKNDFFTPAVELSVLVNNDGGGAIRLKKRAKVGGIVCLVGLLAIVFGVGYYMIFEQEFFSFNTSNSYHAVAKVTVPAEPIIFVEADTVTPPHVDSSAIETSQTNVATEASPQEKSPSSIETISKGNFYVIAGVYSTVQNAEKFIAKAQIKNDTIPYKIMQLNANKFLVTVFESTDETSANHRRTQLQRIDPNLWVYNID